MSRYIYNITLTCEPELLEDVLFYLRERLLPTWRDYDGVTAARLRRLPDEGGYARQLGGDHKEQPEERRLTAARELHRLMQTYPRRVLPFMTKLEVLE